MDQPILPVFPSLARFHGEPSIVKSSRAMKEVCALAARVAASDARVLIVGESGAGKGLLARYIHARSPRARRPFVAADCTELHEELVATELFGHVTGVPGADRSTRGMLLNAHLGTLFLDEISDMSPHLQVTLLRFLESGEIRTPGARRTGITVNVRVISATNRDLTEQMEERRLRQDLLYRLNVIQIVVPPLRDRPEDIRPLVEWAVVQSGRRLRLAANALAAMESYGWPGNVRELQNVVGRLALMAPSDEIDRSDLPSSLFEHNAAAQASGFAA